MLNIAQLHKQDTIHAITCCGCAQAFLPVQVQLQAYQVGVVCGVSTRISQNDNSHFGRRGLQGGDGFCQVRVPRSGS